MLPGILSVFVNSNLPEIRKKRNELPMKQRNSDETDITFILLTKIPTNLTLLLLSESFEVWPK